MSSDPPDTDQAVRAASRRVCRSRSSTPAGDPVALALFSRDDGASDAWARPPPATPVAVSVDERTHGPDAAPEGRHDVYAAPPPANTLAAMFPHYASHVSPHEAQAPLAYAGPWSSGPPPDCAVPGTTRPAPAPPRAPSRADFRSQSLRRAHEWADSTLMRGSARVRARASRRGPASAPRLPSDPPAPSSRRPPATTPGAAAARQRLAQPHQRSPPAVPPPGGGRPPPRWVLRPA